MKVPPQIEFRDVNRTPRLEQLIKEKIARLEKFCDHITSCRVAVERPHQHESGGNPYRIRIDITVPPGHEIVVTKKPGDHDLHDDLKTVINHSFRAAERQLKELTDRQQAEVKKHEEPRALVSKIFPDQGYGFLQTLEGREVYFHKNSVIQHEFDDLAVGTEVRFTQTMGQQGPQATTVHIVNKPGERASERGNVSGEKSQDSQDDR